MKRNPGALMSIAMLGIAGPSAFAQTHAEIVVGRDSAGQLLARFDTQNPYPLPGSRFPGIDGYADGFPGFLSITNPKPGDDFLPPDPAANIIFTLVAADPDITVWNDHGSAPMQPGQTFLLGPPPFDSHPVWNITTADASKNSPRAFALHLRLHDTTGRYRDSDVFSPAFAPDDAHAFYMCPMNCLTDRIYEAPGLCPVCNMHLRLVTPKRFRATLTTSPNQISPDSPTDLRFEIATPEGERLKAFETVHEKLLHLLMVSDDLSWFSHEHPVLGDDGSFTLSSSFPRPGPYTLFLDFTPPRVGQQVVPVTLEVTGPAPDPVPLTPDADREHTVDGYTIRLDAPAPLTAIRTVALTFTLARDNVPITDLEPFLGAMGHLVVVSQDRSRFVHSHPLEPPATATTPRPTGPTVTFSAQFPAPGLYKAWAQFQHHGHVITAPFIFEVTPPAR